MKISTPTLRKKIIFVNGDDPEIGAPHQIMAALWMNKNNKDVIAIVSGPAKRTSINTPYTNLPIISVQRKNGIIQKVLWQLRVAWILVRQAKTSAENPLLYIQGNVAAPAAIIASFFVKYRIIYHTQDYLEPGKHPAWELFEKTICKKAKVVVSNERNRARFLKSHYKISIMPLVVPTALPKEWPLPNRCQQLRSKILSQLALFYSDEPVLVLHQGPYSKVRCSAELLLAMAKLPHNFVLVFTGVDKNTGSHEEVMKKIVDAGMESRTIILGRMPFVELLSYTAACDIGILLYPDDGIGNYYQAPGRLTEYLGCGLPLVMPGYPGFELLNCKYMVGSHCDPTNPESIQQAIISAAKMISTDGEDLRKRLRMLAQEQLSYENNAYLIDCALSSASAGGGRVDP